MTKMLLIT